MSYKLIKPLNQSVTTLTGGLDSVNPALLESDSATWYHQIFDFDDDTGVIEGIKNGYPTEDLVIPTHIYNTEITAIKARAFANRTDIKTIEIPTSITSIGEGAFEGCINIQKAIVPASFSNKFPKNNLVEVTLLGDNDKRTVPEESFLGCSTLEVVNIAKEVTTFKAGAFDQCNHLKIVNYMGEIAEWCSIDFKDGAANPASICQEFYINNKLLTSIEAENLTNVAEIKPYVFAHLNYLTSVGISNSVTSIGKEAFYNCKGLASVEIGNSVTLIGDEAFRGCDNLISVKIGNSVTKIGEGAFRECSGLTSVEIPDSVTEIGSSAFENCYKLVEVINHSSLDITVKSKDYGYVAYYAKEVHQGESKIVKKDGFLFYTFDGINYLLGYAGGKTDFVLPNTYNGESYEIYDYAFYCYRSLTSVVISDSVTKIGEGAFAWCDSLTSVEIGNSVTKIGTGAFFYCSSLTSVVIDDSVTLIGEMAFLFCSSLTSVVIPDSVTEIGTWTFAGCFSLTSVVIGNSVIKIGSSAFESCTKLTEVYYNGQLEDWCGISFDNSNSNPTNNGANLYINDELLTKTMIPDSVTSIGAYAFYNCRSLTSVEIPDSVTLISDEAFYGCDHLEMLTIRSSLPQTEDLTECINQWTPIKTLTIPLSLLSNINESFKLKNQTLSENFPRLHTLTIFASGENEEWPEKLICEYLNITTLTLEESISTIVPGAFANCSQLTTVNINGQLTKGPGTLGVFKGCTNIQKLILPITLWNATDLPNRGKLQEVTIYSKEQSRSISGFENCTKLTSVTLEGIMEIKEDCFKGCTALSEVTISDSVTKIGGNAFLDCKALNKVNYQGTVAQWCGITFVSGDDEQAPAGANPLHNQASLYVTQGSELVELTNIETTDIEGITALGTYVFDGCTSLESIDIPLTVTSIGTAAFRHCINLTQITIPKSVTSIGIAAFRFCSTLRSASILDQSTELDKLTELPSYMFADCVQLESILISASITTLEAGVFSGCGKLTTIYHSGDTNNINNVGDGNAYYINARHYTYRAAEPTSIGAYWYYGENDIPTIWENTQWNYKYIGSTATIVPSSNDDNTTIKSITIPASVTNKDDGQTYIVTGIDTGALKWLQALEEVIIQKDEENDTGFTIGAGAFYATQEKNITIYSYHYKNLTYTSEDYISIWKYKKEEPVLISDDPNTPDDRGQWFYNSDSTIMKWPVLTTDLKYAYGADIGGYSVQVKDSKTPHVVIPKYYCTKENGTNAVVAIQGSLAANNIVESILIPDSVKTIGNNAFYKCSSLTSVVIPDFVTSIGNSAFYNCSGLTSIVIPDSITLISSKTFYYCRSLTSVEIGDSVTSIGDYAFYNCSGLTSVVIPDSVTSIGERAFSNSGLTSITLGDSVASIGSYAFGGCSSLTSVEIPNSVTLIGSEAFRYCYKLVEVINHSSFNITAGSSSYGYVGYYALKIHQGESEVINKDDFLFYTFNGVNYLLGYVDIHNATELILPNDYNGESYEIYEHAFYDCDSLTSVVIPDSLTSISDYAFAWCGDLTSIVIPDSVTIIDEYAFIGCDSLTSVVISDSVTKIGEGAFAGCRSLTSVIIPDSVISIGYEAFQDCINLTSVVIPDSVTSIGDDAFENCYKLVEVINHSSFNITAGSSSYGYVGYYALKIHQGESEVINKDDFLFYTFNGVNYLLGCVGARDVTELVLPNDYNGTSYKIYEHAFYDCDRLTSVIIGDSVTSIGNYAFSSCDRLTSVVIGNSVTSIGENVFDGCRSLTSIVIPDSVTLIRFWAFDSCDSLDVVYYKGSASDWNKISINSSGNDSLTDATRYYYSESEPTGSGNYWHYDENGKPIIWE